MALNADGMDRSIYISYLFAYVAQMSSYSIGGNMLITASTNVKLAAYDFPWYKCDSRVRQVIHLIMIRANRQVNVRAPFIELSLETLGWVWDVLLIKKLNLILIHFNYRL